MKAGLLLASYCLLASFAPAAIHPSIPGPSVPDCIGVNMHFTDPLPGEMEMITAAGFRWVRMDLSWQATEHEAGRYDFSAKALIGPGTSTIDMPYLDTCFRQGVLEDWDAVSVHPYRQNEPAISSVSPADHFSPRSTIRAAIRLAVIST